MNNAMVKPKNDFGNRQLHSCGLPAESIGCGGGLGGWQGEVREEQANARICKEIGVKTECLKLGDGLQLANDPTISGGRHEHNVVHDHMLVVNSFVAIADLQLVLSGVMQLHHVTLWSVKYNFQLVSLIEVAAAQAGLLLAENGLAQPLPGIAGKWALERIEGIRLERLGHAGPREAIVAKDSAPG